MFKDAARHWEYVHFVDFEPSMDAKANEGLMRDLEEYCVAVRDMGCYTKWMPNGEADVSYSHIYH
jgi:prephenate dehydratase